MNHEVRTVFQVYKTTTISFDCYGTLIDWQNGACCALRNIYAYSPSDATDDTLIELFLQADARMIRENVFPYSKVLQGAARSVAERLGRRSNSALEVSFARSLSTWPVFEETNPCLAWLAARYQLAIISNVDDDLLSQTLEQISAPVRVKVTSEQTKSYKPDRTIFERAVDLIGDPPANVVHIAEGRCEATPARAVGMRSIWVNRTPRSDDGSNAKPHAVASNLSQVVEALS